MRECFMKYLKGKTIVLITHALYYLKYADHIFVIDDGSVNLQGNYSDLQKIPQFNELMQKIKNNYSKDPSTQLQDEEESLFSEKDSNFNKVNNLNHTLTTENKSLFENSTAKGYNKNEFKF